MVEKGLLGLGAHGFHRIVYFEWGDPRSEHVLVCVHGLAGRVCRCRPHTDADGQRADCRSPRVAAASVLGWGCSTHCAAARHGATHAGAGSARRPQFSARPSWRSLPSGPPRIVPSTGSLPAHRVDEGRLAWRYARIAEGRPDECRIAEAARLRNRAIRQEPSRRSQRIPAHRARFR